MVKLADLFRVYGVGPVFARLLFDGGADTVESLSQADSEQLFRQLEKKYLEAGNTTARRISRRRTFAFASGWLQIYPNRSSIDGLTANRGLQPTKAAEKISVCLHGLLAPTADKSFKNHGSSIMGRQGA